MYCHYAYIRYISGTLLQRLLADTVCDDWLIDGLDVFHAGSRY